jgi:hypothetical protein
MTSLGYKCIVQWHLKEKKKEGKKEKGGKKKKGGKKEKGGGNGSKKLLWWKNWDFIYRFCSLGGISTWFNAVFQTKYC